jgi:hypothetical protein
MFTGHYGLAFALKGTEPRLQLWMLFLAVQAVDVAWAILILLGVEHVRIVPGFTRTNPLDLYHFPYTHGLVATAVWFAATVAAYRWSRGRGTARPALLLGLAVASHWFLDLIVHVPDLPLYDDAAKVGLGLWNRPAAAFLLETALLFGGLLFYLSRTQPATPRSRVAFPILALVMLALQAGALLGPPPPSVTALGVSGLGGFAVLTALAAWLERGRRPPAAP